MIHTTTIRVISDEELARANALETERDGLAVEVERLEAVVGTLEAELDLLRNPAPPPPTQTARERLYVDGRTLRRRNGVAVRCGVESMFATQNITQFVECHAALGADIMSPLFQGRWMPQSLNVAKHIPVLDVCRNRGLVMGYNVDHMMQEGVGQNGRDWLKRPEVVSMLNSYNNVFIECEVETGWGQTVQQWRDDVIAMVLELRGAGHLSPIKVGSPAGGRRPLEALAAGAQVVAADPLHQVIFTWQRYWPVEVRNGWSYQSDNGVESGVAGSIEMAHRIAQSGLCFVVGEESRDGSGAENGTGFEQVIPVLKQLGIIWQWWVLSNGDDPTALVSDSNNPASLTSMGNTVRALLLNS
jgi:hypothetical protein